MKKLLIALILILLAGAGGYAYWKYGKPDDKATVTQAPLQQGNIVQAVQATGTLEALRNVQVGSQVSGIVKTLNADFNSIVKKDQVIAVLDPALLEVQVEVQQANIERQQGDIEQQKVQLENDQVNLKRTQAQFEKGLVSPQQLETAQLQVKTREAQINSAQKQLVQSEAQLNQAKLNVSYCTITSPVDGVVVDRKVDIGQAVQASMTTPQFFTIATDLTTLKLSASVDEADIGYVRRGMTVSFTVDSYQQQTFYGTVDAVRLNAQTQNNVVTYPVWINVQNPDLKLRPSMTASLRIIVDQANNVLKVPNQALRFRPTSDIYTWLGMTPPASGRGRGGANANADASGRGGANAKVDASGRAGTGRGANAQNAGAPGQGGSNLQADAAAGQNGGGRRRRATDGSAANPAGANQGGVNPGGVGQNRQQGQGQGQGQNGQRGGQLQNQGQNGGRGGAGFGRGMGNNLTPEQMAQFQQRFGGRGGRGGAGGGGGRNQMAGQQSGQNGSDMTPLVERNADKIDDLFSSVPKRIQPGTVWIYDEKAADPNKKLRQVNVRIGLADTQFSELVSSSEPLSAGSTVVTGVVPPASALPKAGQQNIFQPQRGGFGPGGGGGGPRGGGGGRGGD